VRETFWRKGRTVPDIYGEELEFLADNAVAGYCATDPTPDGNGWSKYPSIFMPRWASRIQLRVLSVRLERLQDMSAEDAFAEGVRCDCMNPEACPNSAMLIPKFRELWNSINAKRGYSWDSNPWVWVVEFERVK